MRKRLLSKAVVAASVMAVSASAFAGNYTMPDRFAKFAGVPQLRSFTPGVSGTPVLKNGAQARLASVAPSHVLPAGEDFTWLLAPDGNVWYATFNKTYEEVELPGGMATQKLTTGFEITVYDNLCQEIGKVKDVCTLAEGETRVADVQLDMNLSQKFFNFDNNYELLVTVFCNTPEFTVNSHTKVYSIGATPDESGNTPVVTEFSGYVVDAVNYATSKFSEDFLMTVMDSEQPVSADDYESFEEFSNAYKYKLTTYKKAGYSGGPVSVLELELPWNNIPGNQDNTPFFMLGTTADGKPALIFSKYEKSFWVNSDDLMAEPSVTPDNSLTVDVYTMPSATSTVNNKEWSVSIPTEMPSDGNIAKYYGVGLLRYTDDVNFTDYTADGTPAFVVTVLDVPSADLDNPIRSYYVYDLNGQKTLTIDENANYMATLSDIKGEHAQALFIKEDNTLFHIVDLVTGQTVVDLPLTVGGYSLTTGFDRVALAGRPMYAVSLGDHLEDAEGNTVELVGWITPEGEMDHVDELNIGRNVQYAQVYISASTLDPYLFDTDADMEYLVLVKRQKAAGSTAADEVLLIADAKSAPIFEAGPDEAGGALMNISVLNSGSTPTLHLLYADGTDSYTQRLYDLPLNKFQGGEGTPGNPYLIATIADLQQMKSALTASYKLAADIDGTGFSFKPVEGFSGTLDGDGHTVANFTTGHAQYQAMLGTASMGAVVKDIIFTDPVLDLASGSAAGVVVANGMGITVDNIHIYGLKATGEEFDGTFGSVGGILTNSSAVNGCFVAGADINLPEASAGGIAGDLRTSSSVKTSAFSGILTANSSVGGIVGNGGTDFTVEDCHADADITANHTVGGIVGEAARGLVNRNIAEGSVKGIAPQWGRVYVGGIAGSLASLTPSDWDDEGNPIYPENTPKVITNNIVALTALEAADPGTEAYYPGQLDTAHRIVGRTSANDEPMPIGYDEEWNPIYSDEPVAPDAGLENNYVLGDLALIQATIADDHTSTEGKTLADGEFGREFLEGLGYAYGTSADAPWSELALNVPYLHFEQKIFLPQTEFSVTEGESFTVNVHILTRGEMDPETLMGDFICDYNEQTLEMTDMALANNVLSLTFKCLNALAGNITLSMLGSSATVTVYGFSGIENVGADNNPVISYDGNTVSCADSHLAIYNMAGVLVASGNNSVATDSLAKGVYVVTAVSANGKSALKIAVK